MSINIPPILRKYLGIPRAVEIWERPELDGPLISNCGVLGYEKILHFCHANVFFVLLVASVAQKGKLWNFVFHYIKRVKEEWSLGRL